MRKRAVLTFLLGSVRDPYTAKQIDREYKTNGDIFQARLLKWIGSNSKEPIYVFQISMADSYRALAYKTLTSYLWHSTLLPRYTHTYKRALCRLGAVQK